MTMMYPVERGDQQAFIALAVTFAILPAIVVFLRVYARHLASRQLDISDWLMVIASGLLVVYQGVNISAVLTGGLGYPLAEIKGRFGVASGQEVFVKHLIVMQMFWCITITIIKISVLILYIKIFSLPIFVIAAKCTCVFIILWAITMGLGACLICQPFSFYWDQSTPGGWCGNSNALWIATGVMNIMSDVAILILPMPYLHSLELALYKKIVLMLTFGIGFLVCIVSAVRIFVLVHYDPHDTTGTTLPTALLSFLEPSVGIILACVPILRPLVRHVLSHVTRSHDYGDKKSSKSSGGFSKLQEHGSLPPSRPKLRPETNITNESTAVYGDDEENDIELGRIGVRTTWKVESEDSSGSSSKNAMPNPR